MPLGRRLLRTIARPAGPQDAPAVRAYALVEIGDPGAIELFLREEDPVCAREEALRDEPDWVGALTVEPVESDEREVSLN
jgi:hypothetical protein